MHLVSFMMVNYDNDEMDDVEEFVVKKDAINKLWNKIENIETKIQDIESFATKYQNDLKNKIGEINTIKKDLQDYRDQVVGGSLFSSYEIRMTKNDRISERYSLISVSCFAISALTMLALLLASFVVEHDQINYVIPSSISIISFTAAFFCSAKSKVYHKAAEEYAHKATLLKSFVGYRSNINRLSMMKNIMHFSKK